MFRKIFVITFYFSILIMSLYAWENISNKEFVFIFFLAFFLIYTCFLLKKIFDKDLIKIYSAISLYCFYLLVNTVIVIFYFLSHYSISILFYSAFSIAIVFIFILSQIESHR